MPVSFDSAPLEMFGNAGFGNANAVIHLDQDKHLKSDSSYSSLNIFRWMRGSEAERKNNEIRTQLLKSLGESFGLSGVKTGVNGEVTFSKEFMDKLQKLLGPAFKRSDFGVPDKGGAVSSGKPLTARRLQAIYASAGIYDISHFDFAAYKQKIGAILKEQFGMETTLNMAPDKFEAMARKSTVFQVYAGIEKSLDFLQNHFKGFMREEPGYNYAKDVMGRSDEELEDYKVRFQIKDLKTGKYEDMRRVDDVNDIEGRHKHSPNQALFDALRGNLIHTERADFNSATSRDIAPLNKYVEGTLKSFVKNGIDAYLEAKMNGKLDALMEHLKNPGACTEEKGMRFYEFRQKHFQQKVDAKLEAELKTIIKNTDFTPLDKAIEVELENISSLHPEFKTWKEYGPELKRRLVGLHRPMVDQKVIGGKTTFVTQKDNSDSLNVRAITAEDIDTVGKQVYEMVFGED